MTAKVSGFPGIYARVQSVLAWVEDVTEGKMKMATAEDKQDNVRWQLHLSSLLLLLCLCLRQSLFPSLSHSQNHSPSLCFSVSVVLSVHLRGLEGIPVCHTGRQQEEEDVSDIDFNGAMWAVVRGKCTMDEYDCIMSPAFPDPYPSKESCLIAVNVTDAVPIRVENFSTEPSFDFLSFDCQAFSGDIGPDGIVPDPSIHWAADHSIAGTGWRLCPSF